MTTTADLPVAIVGAGPVGLAAAAHLVERNIPGVIFEAGDRVGAAVLDWAHVTLFSPWRYVVDAAARRLLEADGWQMPDEESYPTGGALVGDYLEPLSKLPSIASMLVTDATVTDIARVGADKLKNGSREQQPFEVRVETAAGSERLHFRAVIDASGTWWNPNPVGANGLPAWGEEQVADRIAHGIPDVLGVHRERYAGRRIVVIGSGHSAQNVVRDLATLREDDPSTAVTWLVRRPEAGQMFGGGTDDQLPARGRLGSQARALVDAGTIDFVAGFRVERVVQQPDGMVLEAEDGRRVGPIDQIVASTGFRPDLGMLREIRLDLDPVVEATRTLAPLIDPNLHSCGSVPPHGYRELQHREPDLYVAGAKSYGRAPTFLLATGYEQVRSVVAALAGDIEAAEAMMLDLPATGVCVSDATSTPDAPAAACCGSAPSDTTVEPPRLIPAAPAAAVSVGSSTVTTEPLPVASTTSACCGTTAPEPEPVGAAASGACCG